MEGLYEMLEFEISQCCSNPEIQSTLQRMITKGIIKDYEITREKESWFYSIIPNPIIVTVKDNSIKM
jgi:hypothetical protein